MMKRQCRTLRVLENRAIGQSGTDARFYELILEHPGWEEWKPGQFVMVRPDWGGELTWGRPFSICNCDDDGLKIFYQIVGRGTGRMTQLSPGDGVVVWGPLGNGFEIAESAPTLLLAGGIGIAPFVGYCAQHPAPENLRLIFGHREPLERYPFEDFPRSMASESWHECGPGDLEKFVGRVGELMGRYADGGMALACGPQPFLRAIQNFARQTGTRTQLSLENRMACGVGACLGCVSPDAENHRVQVCTHGPVFWSDEIQLDEVKAESDCGGACK